MGQDTALNFLMSLGTEATDNVLFTRSFVQSRKYQNTEWTITSFDIVMGLIGGFVGLIWDGLGYWLGNYESFKFN